jgi:hypothetical protein
MKSTKKNISYKSNYQLVKCVRAKIRSQVSERISSEVSEQVWEQVFCDVWDTLTQFSDQVHNQLLEKYK